MSCRMKCFMSILLLEDRIPSHVAMLVRDIVTYRKGNNGNGCSVSMDTKNSRGYLKIFFHSEGIDNYLPSILHC